MTHRETTELIERCARGDAGAWRELVDRFRPAIVRVLIRTSPASHPADVCDLEQDVWTRVLVRDRHALRQLRGRDDASVKAFLCTVALNVARDAQRRAGVRPESSSTDLEALEGLPGNESDPEAAAGDRERRRQLAEAAREEASDARDLLIFQMYYEDGASAPEIAAVPALGLTTKGVETVIHRVTQRVKRRLHADA